jgi:hypothetical protein
MKRRLVFIFLSFALACSDSESPSPEITCDAWKLCMPDGGVSINELLCRSAIADPVCAASYRVWLRCVTDGCARGDDGGVTERCPTERDAYAACQLGRIVDSGTD